MNRIPEIFRGRDEDGGLECGNSSPQSDIGTAVEEGEREREKGGEC